jgi:hypothetical protein
MRKFSHPAVLPLHAAFVSGKELWFITPYMVRTGATCCPLLCVQQLRRWQGACSGLLARPVLS